MHPTIQHSFSVALLILIATTHLHPTTSAFTPFSSKSFFTQSSSTSLSSQQKNNVNVVGSGIQLSDQKSWAKQEYQNTKESTARETYLKHKAAEMAREAAEKEAKVLERQQREAKARESVMKMKAEEMARVEEEKRAAARDRAEREAKARQQIEDEKKMAQMKIMEERRAAEEARARREAQARATIKAKNDASKREVEEQRAELEARARRAAEAIAAIKREKQEAIEEKEAAMRERAQREQMARRKIEEEKKIAAMKAEEERKAELEERARREEQVRAAIKAKKEAAKREMEERRAETEARERRAAEAMAAIKKEKEEALRREMEERKAAEDARTAAIAEANQARKEAALSAERAEMEQKIAEEKARAQRIAEAMAAMKAEANAVLDDLNGEGEDFRAKAAAIVEVLQKNEEEINEIDAEEYNGDFDDMLPTIADVNRQLNIGEEQVVEKIQEAQDEIQEVESEEELEDFPSIEQLNSLLDAAVQASKVAGQIIVSNLDSAEVSKLKANPRDLLTEIDPLCESTIRDIILNQFPDHKFLGEEAVDPGKDASASALENKLKGEDGDDSDFLWIVDPIDGTSNFVHGMPLCMPSIACTYKGQTIIGVIYDPHRDEIFTAIKDQGAQMNGKPIEVGKQATVGDAIVAMGSPPGEESMEMSLRGIQELMPKCRTIRMLGSAALMLAWVANGRLTAYWEYDLSSWDIAAGALLITEAGGKFTDLANGDYNLTTRKICGSNGLVHDELVSILNNAGVE